MNTKNSEDTSTFDTSNDSNFFNNEDQAESSEQKSNFRGTKIARRARSFKDDFFEKISQMRTPTNTISRSHSPKAKNTPNLIRDDSSKTTSYDLNYHARQVKHSLTHFKDVINKNKLEMLPGNVTIVLESIANIHSVLKAQKSNEHSSAIISATQQVFVSLGNLIKLCDDALISDNEENFIALNKETVTEIIESLDNAVNNLVNQAYKKADNNSNVRSKVELESESLEQRSSLPDIPLSKKEKIELQNAMHMQNSQSSESVLFGITPPPKPSKDHKPDAPPLPPKKKAFSTSDETDNIAQVSSQFHHDRRIDYRIDDFDRNTFDDRRSLESMQLPKIQQPNDFEVSSMGFKECKFEINQEFNSQVFQSISSDMNDIDNSFSFMSLNQSHKVMAEQNITSSESIFHSESSEHEQPPPLPVKTRSRSLRLEQPKSVYDNIEDNNRISLDTKASVTSSNSSLTSSLSARNETISENFFHHQSIVKNKYKSCIEPVRNFGMDVSDDNENPPPLPMKKKHIMAYMEIFGNASHSTHVTHDDATLVRHSMHSFSHNARLQSQSTSFQSSLMPKNSQFTPPALPPKKTKISSSNASLNSLVTPPVSPKIVNDNVFTSSKIEEKINNGPTMIDNNEAQNNIGTLNEDEIKDNGAVVLRKKPNESTNFMEELDVQSFLSFKRDSEEASDILMGGRVDALIIHATKNTAQKSSEAFGEAFLLTYRTFINPNDLIEKLIYRYTFFNCQNNDQKQRAAKESFSLLVRVVNDLTSPDLSTNLMEKLIQFVYDLVCGGELLMAKLLRVKLIEKSLLLKRKAQLGPNFLSSRPVMSNPPSLLDLKSTDIAEQMTILDAELFHKIEIPEVLIWAQEQCEERSPNLTLFTAHFNKLSYWTRTQILKQQDARDREKHVMKFIKIMKHLRKINNFNSYLALLSALDSAPIRRLEWQKNITEGLKEYCALIDSSSSFRAYRQALSETNPPCIPYIGLVLQDLTFVHIGNPDFLPGGSVNFSKRWQQYNIVINMKRFRNCSYAFKKNERIIGFFDNFDEYFDEDAMWQISEKIKPRGGKRVLSN
ncbi:CLUMA_CG013275, isoform B [Clunio marinus]|uniref:CRK SH3-binding GNRP n=1 Tax=Clunio marinus TaxID=568069 RepID=A0A1J1II99_9DIPT|nr:CLUMA_CG013275, isoform B [Clunio marinus]